MSRNVVWGQITRIHIFFARTRCWTLHCLMNALPSFIIATFWLQLGKSPSALAAMFAAIFTFVVLYSTLTSLRGPLSDENHLLARSLKLGAKVRAWISILSLPLLASHQLTFFIPDFWCGFLSISLLDGVAKHLNPSSRIFAVRSIHDWFNITMIRITTNAASTARVIFTQLNGCSPAIFPV